MLIILDTIYKYPDAVREFALEQEFSVKGNFPGARTMSFANNTMKKVFEHYIGPITYWPRINSYNGAFQLSNSNDKSWIHQDENNNWAAVVYLTPDAPISGGTGFFEPKVDNPDPYITEHWNQVDTIGNLYNRAIIFDSKQWHTSMVPFDGRLTQTFFFS